ncbi:hypothetical protein NLU13_1526 [Sarocladium strictum]|uniref:Uncharacterized protein n=1 Tax=Sarocladium strictum TaxID=5046 RepID=A0AA39LCB3_SARSR|nr:hypothetical protein NLU13_1526 [Sarocladium strictum]
MDRRSQDRKFVPKGTQDSLNSLAPFIAPAATLPDDECDSEPDPQVTLANTANSKTIVLSFVSNYSSHWKPREAFREILQNWRDGIVRSFKLKESD